ncbi:tape measure protein [Schleiferilactobacillus harbinensis]|uniref:tape measure protein n=1 Tax=Schleiferilactobacillus harbinensis TaxID=304207 RepID=UPI001166F051|nr:tape measure protein [Schleiferilactobacillus harbinensis]GEK06657.1 tape measure protein [Schleiferilactobacillus harbinensis]
MTQQINAEMSTSVALDLLGASQSIKSLTAIVRSNQSAWKSQETELKSAGDAAGAAQARYEGLGRSITDQQAKIDALKSKQAELKGTTSETAEQFLKYQQQIDGASKQLASMQAQQDRAKQAMDYQKSGLASLQSEYTAAARANQVYVERLQAEGNQQEANKAKIEGYKSSISNLNEQLSKQSEELDKIAAASGKDSDAYRTQQNRINETATSLAKAKSSMTGLQDEMHKANPSVFSRIKTAIEGTNKQAEKTPSLFKKIVEGGVISNAITNGWSDLSGAIKDTVKSGLELDEAGEKSATTWEQMGKSAKDVQSLGDQVSSLTAKSGQAISTIGGMQKTVDVITHGNTKMTEAVTAGITAIGTGARLNGDQLSGFAKQLTRVTSQTKLSTSSLARLEKTAPNLGAQLAKAAGVSQDAFAKMVSAGKVSSTDFLNLLAKTGKNSSEIYKDFGKTAEGAQAQMSASWDVLKKKMAAPLLSVKNTGMSELASLMSSSAVQGAATMLGKGIANIATQATKLLGYLAAHRGDITGIGSSVLSIAKTFGMTVWHTISGVVSSIARSLGLMGSGASKSADPLRNANTALGNIAKNKTAIQTLAKTLVALWATTKIVKFTAAIGGAFKGLSALRGIKDFGALSKLSSAGGLGGVTKAFGALKLLLAGPGGIVLAIAAAGLAFYEAYKHIKPFHDAVNNVAKTIGNALKPALKAVISGMQAMWKGIQPILNQIGKLFQTTWSLVVKVIQVAWKTIKPIVDVLFGYFKAQFSIYAKVLPAVWKGMWSIISTVLSATWKVLKDTISSALKIITDILKVGMDLLSGNWSKAWSDIKKLISDVWNGMKRIVSDVFGGIHDVIKTTLGAIKGVWDAAWSGMKSAFSDMWDGMKNAASDGMNAIINVINGAISGINWVWKKFTGKDALHKLSPVHFEQGGVVTQKLHMVMVNDGAGADWKELYQLPNGQVGMSQKRNATGLLPEGTRVYNGQETKAIMNMAGIEHYDLGGVIGGVGKFFSGAWDKAKEVADWLAHPIENVGKLIKSSVSGISSGVEMFSNLAGGVVNKLISHVADWFKGQLKKIQQSMDDSSLSGGAKKSYPELESIARQAASIMGVNPSGDFIKALANVAMSESGGNSNAANLTDSNAMAGMASIGLLQYIPATWDYYNVPGHNNRSSVLDNFVHFFNNSDWQNSIGYVTYPSWGGMYKWDWRNDGPQGAPRMANGGLVNQPLSAIVGEDGPEAVMPLSTAKASRAWQLLGQAMTVINHGQQPVSSTDGNDVSEKLDTLHDDLAGLTQAIQQMVVVSVLNPDDAAKALNEPLTKIQNTTIKINKTLSRNSYQNGGATVIG